MRNILTTICILLISVSLMSQKTINDPNAEVREVKGFKGIKVATGIQLVLTQGSTEAVAISAASQEDRDRIKTVVENGVLKIHYDYNFWKLMNGRINKKLKAYVSIVTAESLDASSGATLSIDGEIKSDDLSVDASSGAIIKGKVKANTMNVDQSSGAVIELSGEVNDLEIDGSSGSVFNSYGLLVNSCKAETSSGAVAHVTVNKEISGRASSGGVVSFKGDGAITRKSTSSGGRVAKVN